MKTKTLFLITLIISIGNVFAQKSSVEQNNIVSFLDGKWNNFSIFISDKNPVTKQDYKETMAAKNDTTITITAHKYKDGNDLTRDIYFIVDNENIIMKQGSFKAVGKREGNVYYLKGYSGEKEYRFRLYTMGDKYIFHNEVWADGKIEMMNMSYLIRE